MAFTLTSTAFAHEGQIPQKYTGDGPDVSPPLSWTEPPDGTRGFVLICDDPDAPVGTWVHWVLYDIPATVREVKEEIAAEKTVLGSARHGRNDFGRFGYGGPAPPPGKPHRYFFRLYAVDAETGLAAGASKAQVMKAIRGHVLAEAVWMGTYGR